MDTVMESDSKIERVKPDSKLSVTQRFYLELSAVAMGVFLAMFAYEFLKTYFLPELTIWESHFITIAFSTIMATLAAYLILKRRNHILREITESRDGYRQALAQLELTEQKFQEVFNQANDIISLHTLDNGLPGRFMEINEVGTTILGYDHDEFINMKLEDLLSPGENSEIFTQSLDLNTKDSCSYETIFQSKEGELIPVESSYRVFQLHGEPVVIAVSRDITERKIAEEKIKKSLEEKELLLKEIHHRVKNNLMIISSLLNLQSQTVDDERSRDSFKDIQNRARSMALIHEKLYQSTDLKRIDFGEYIRTLATELFHTYASTQHIKLLMDVEKVFVDINTAIPLGLIINEIITNSLKHGFPNGKEGEIRVELHSINDSCEFKVKDDGIGFPENLDFRNTDSLGLQLVNSLTQQIDGEINMEVDHGTEFIINFKSEPII